MPIALVPAQIAKELSASSISFNPLTSLRLRDILKRDPTGHCDRLKGRYELLLHLLKYACADLERPSTEGDFTRKRAYGELAGCPLLSMGYVYMTYMHTCMHKICICTQNCAYSYRCTCMHIYIH
jgi:hypothetical protein